MRLEGWRIARLALPAARSRPGSCKSQRPSKNGGRRECRANGSPKVSRVKEKHTKVVTTGLPKRSGIPRAMVLRFPSCSPRRSGFVSPSLPRSIGFSRTWCQRRGIRTTRLRRPPRLRSSCAKRKRPPLPAPNVRDDWPNVPLDRARDARRSASDLPDVTSEIACDTITRRANQVRLEKSCQVTSNCLRVPDAAHHEVVRRRAGTQVFKGLTHDDVLRIGSATPDSRRASTRL